MNSIHFAGRIVPAALSVTIRPSPEIKWDVPDLGSVTFRTTIQDSSIDVTCELADFDEKHIAALYMRALDLCRAQVDLVAFRKGWGLTVLLETFVDPGGTVSVLAQQDEELASLCTTFDLDREFEETLARVIQSPPLFMALRDLTAAITLPHVSPVDCGRAMDRLKHLVAPGAANDKTAWAELRRHLQIDEAYLRFMTDQSANPRHGRSDVIPSNITREIVRRAWTIMNRYFEYLKRGRAPLSSEEFPLLSES